METTKVTLEDLKGLLESIAYDLESIADQYDFDAEAEDKARCEAEGEEYVPWECETCGTGFDLFEDAALRAKEIREVIARL